MNRGRAYLGWLLLGVLLAAAFLPVIGGRRTLLPLEAGVMPDGPWGYRGPRPKPAVLDPAASAIKYLPYTRLASESWRKGEIPFWNPYNGCGVPLWANGEAFACAPLRVPLYLSPTPGMWNAYWLGRLWLAGGLAFSLAAAVGMPFVPALAAGAAYMLGGYLVMNLNLFHLDVDCLLPGLLLSIEAILRRRSKGAFAAVAFVTWLMSLGGSQQALVVDALLVAAWVLARSRDSAGRIRAGWALACGMAGALPHWFPLAELARRSVSLHGLEGLRSGAAAMSAVSAARLAGPWAAPAGSAPFYYAGVSVLLLASIGAWAAWMRPGSVRGPARLLSVAVALELAKIFGAPGSALLGSLPGLSMVWWIKYAAPLFLSLALLAGWGVERLAGCVRSRRRTPAAAALAVLVAAELAALRPGPLAAPHDPLAPAPYVTWLRERLAREPGWRICGVGSILIPDTSAAFRLPDIRLEDTLIDREQYRLLFEGVSAPKPPRHSMFVTLDALDARRLSALRALGVRYLLAPSGWSPPPSLAPDCRRVYRNEISIWRVSGSLQFAGFPERGRGWLLAGCVCAAVLVPSLLASGLLLL